MSSTDQRLICLERVEKVFITMRSLRELNRESATICMVTHDLRYTRHAGRTIHLFDGQVVEKSVEVS